MKKGKDSEGGNTAEHNAWKLSEVCWEEVRVLKSTPNGIRLKVLYLLIVTGDLGEKLIFSMKEEGELGFIRYGRRFGRCSAVSVRNDDRGRLGLWGLAGEDWRCGELAEGDLGVGSWQGETGSVRPGSGRLGL